MLYTLLVIELLALSSTLGYHYKRVCFYDRKAQTRPGVGKCNPEQLNSDYCTHLIYAHATISNNRMKAAGTEDDTTITRRGMYERFNHLKRINRRALTMLSVGGPDFTAAQVTHFLSNAESRREFVRTSTHFLRQRGFDGLDVDFRYPGISGINDFEYDRHRFALFLQVILTRAYRPHELHNKFRKETLETGLNRLILSVSVSGIKHIMETAYSFKSVASSVDFLNLKAFDFHTAADGKTGINAPLHSRQSESEAQQQKNVEYAAYLWHKRAQVPKRKIIIGMPMYGRTFLLKSAKHHGIDHSVTGYGNAGMYTKSEGMLSYYEICKMFLVEHRGHPVTGVWNKDHKSPFLFTNQSWVSYDDRSSLKAKVEWLRNKGFGGWMAWSIDLDDFSGRFCDSKHRKFPLLEILNKATYSRYDGHGDYFGSKQELNIYENTLCSGRKDGLFRSSHSCRKFYKCYREKSTLFICPEKLIFDKKHSRCEFESKMSSKDLKQCKHHEILDSNKYGNGSKTKKFKNETDFLDAYGSPFTKGVSSAALAEALRNTNVTDTDIDLDPADFDLSSLPKANIPCARGHLDGDVYSMDKHCREYTRCDEGFQIAFTCPEFQLYDGIRSDCSPRNQLDISYVEQCSRGNMTLKPKKTVKVAKKTAKGKKTKRADYF